MVFRLCTAGTWRRMDLNFLDKLTGRSPEEKYKDYVSTFRKNNIPSKFNQIKLMDDLMSDEIDHYMSISNRADGKSFNYIHFLMNLALDAGVKFMLISRMYTVRQSYQELIEKIALKSKRFEPEKISFIRTQYYVKVHYKNHQLGIITDLNSATNLKYSSNFLSEFPMMIYDEFLALDGDYLGDEWDRLKTIYGSVNREENVPVLGYPKILYLGNAVNFSSPILSHLNLFNKLENHPINTKQQYQNILLEMNRNDNQNEMRNMRAFDEFNDHMAMGQFKVNNYNVATEADRKAVMINRKMFHVKLLENYLRVDYNLSKEKIILSVIGHSDDYQFNTELKDNTEQSKYIDQNYYSDMEYKNHKKGVYLYDNQYTKEQFSNMFNLENLKIKKLIKQYEKLNGEEWEEVDKRYEINHEEQTKKSLFKKFFTSEY